MEPRWRALAVLSAARVSMGFQFQAVGASAPMLRETYGLGLADIGWLVGLYLLPGIVLALPGGMLSSRFGDRRIATLGTALMVAGGGFAALATDVTSLQAARLIGGVGGVIFNVTGTKMVADWFVGREIQFAMAVFVGTWPAGIALGLLVLGPVAVALSPTIAFALTGAMALVSLLLVVTLDRPAPDAPPPGPLRLSALAPGDGVRLALSSGAWMAYNVAFALLVAFLPTLFAARGMSVTLAAPMTAVLSVMLTASIPVAGWLIGRYGHPLRFAIAGVLGWIVTVAALRAGGDPLAWLVLAGLFAGTAAGPLVSSPAQFLSPAARSVGLGVFYTLFYLGMAVLPRAVGAAADTLGSPEVVLAASIGFAFATIVLMLATDRAIVAPRKA